MNYLFSALGTYGQLEKKMDCAHLPNTETRAFKHTKPQVQVLLNNKAVHII